MDKRYSTVVHTKSGSLTDTTPWFLLASPTAAVGLNGAAAPPIGNGGGGGCCWWFKLAVSTPAAAEAAGVRPPDVTLEER